MNESKKGAGRLGELSDHDVGLTPVKEKEGSMGRKSLELQCSSKEVSARLMKSP